VEGAYLIAIVISVEVSLNLCCHGPASIGLVLVKEPPDGNGLTRYAFGGDT